MRVFKYRGGDDSILRRDLKSICKSQIFSAPISTLNDPFEAKVEINTTSFEFSKVFQLIPNLKKNEELQKTESVFLDKLSEFVQKSKDWGVYSLSRSYNDELLWAYYADSHRGFCIEYDLEKLKEYKIPNEPTLTVEYESQIPKITSLDILGDTNNQEILQKKLIGTKSKRWVHENEVRIVTGQAGLYDYDYRAVKCIYFGYRSSERFRRLTMRVLKGRKIQYFVMKPKDGAYKLEKEEIADIYPNAPECLGELAVVGKNVPAIDETLKPYESLVRQAIEITRREPYCETILDAYLSTKGTEDNPVFYVTYERSDGVPRNKFLSKAEIDTII